MKINKRFLHFKTLSAFEEALSQDLIRNDSIAFIADKELIWTHGEYYADNKVNFVYEYGDEQVTVPQENICIFTTQDIYDNLSDYEKNAIYFIVESLPERERPEGEYGRVFGDKFPIKFSWSFGSEFPVILS